MGPGCPTCRRSPPCPPASAPAGAAPPRPSGAGWRAVTWRHRDRACGAFRKGIPSAASRVAPAPAGPGHVPDHAPRRVHRQAAVGRMVDVGPGHEGMTAAARRGARLFSGPRLTTPGTGTVNGSIPGPPTRRLFPASTILPGSPDSHFPVPSPPRGYWRPIGTAGMSSLDLTVGLILVMSGRRASAGGRGPCASVPPMWRTDGLPFLSRKIGSLSVFCQTLDYLVLRIMGDALFFLPAPAKLEEQRICIPGSSQQSNDEVQHASA